MHTITQMLVVILTMTPIIFLGKHIKSSAPYYAGCATWLLSFLSAFLIAKSLPGSKVADLTICLSIIGQQSIALLSILLLAIGKKGAQNIIPMNKRGLPLSIFIALCFGIGSFLFLGKLILYFNMKQIFYPIVCTCITASTYIMAIAGWKAEFKN